MKKTEILSTEAGKIRGYIENNILVFKGIPYAEPPIGDLRFNKPVLKESWDGVFDAFDFGPEVPQPITVLTPRPHPKQDEAHSLVLNIWAPEITDKKQPVMVWIHGGAFTSGSGSRTNVINLAKRGKIVLITINYRLGPLANLVLPNIPANLDMLDQITALKWIKNNIEDFGGDPENVTIFGESAGGQSVCVLMAIPEAKGLFHRVIAQSGRALPQAYKLSDRKRVTEWIFEELNLKTEDIETFRTLPVEEIINASMKAQLTARSNGIYNVFGPTIDGKTLPEHPLKAIMKGVAKDIELIIGSNLEEWKLFNLLNPNFKEINAEKLPNVMKRALQNAGEDENKGDFFINTYIESRKESKLAANPQDIIDAFITDYIFRIPAIKFAEAQSNYQENTYMYLFSWQSKLGSIHGLDIPFVFNTLSNQRGWFNIKKSEETETLSKNMMDAWTAFARKRNPSHENIPKWPQYETKKRATIVFDKSIRVWEDPLKKEREMWYKMKIWSQFLQVKINQ
jgi:para-nitrobenzyl esterase